MLLRVSTPISLSREIIGMANVGGAEDGWVVRWDRAACCANWNVIGVAGTISLVVEFIYQSVIAY